MTVSSAQSRKTYAGNGVTTSFSTNPVVFFSASDLVVVVTQNSTGDTETLILETDYTVSGGGSITPAAGSVNLAGGSSPYGAPASGYSVAIYRNLSLVQETDFVQNDGSDADVQEAALDRLTMIAQRLDERIDRSVVLPDGDVTGASMEIPALEDRASKVLGFDADGALTTYDAASAVTTAANITYAPVLASTVSRTVQNKLQYETVSIFDFIAPGNHAAIIAGTDVNDWSTELANAMAQVPAGAELLILGTINYSTGFTRSTPIIMRGQGINGLGRTALKYNGSGVAATFQTSQNGLRLQDFRLVGTVAATDGILIQDCQNGMLLDHILVEAFTKAAANCLRLDDCWDITAIGSQFRQSSRGIVSDIGATYGVVNTVRLIGCDINDLTEIGVKIMSGVGWLIHACDFSGLASNAVGVDIAPSLSAGTGRQAKKHVVQSCYFEKAPGATNVTAVRVGASATIGVSTIKDNKIADNYIDVGGDQISVDKASSTVIADNLWGSLEGGKYSIKLTANADKTKLITQDRGNISDSGTNTKYITNDLNTITEAADNFTSPNRGAVVMCLTADILNQTGNGTEYTVAWDSEVLDRQSEQHVSNGTFTAQKTGLYDFDTVLTLNAITGATQATMRLVVSGTSARNYTLEDLRTLPGSAVALSGGGKFPMTAGDTAVLKVTVAGVGADTSDILAGSTTKNSWMSVAFLG